MDATEQVVPDALLEALRAQGAHLFDPVRFHYIAALAGRASAYRGSVRRVLDAKLQAAAAALQVACAQAQGRVASPNVAEVPEAPDRQDSLAGLVRYLHEHALDKPHTPAVASPAPRTELKSVQYFRNTWSKLSAEKQVTQALGQAPRNAGPINSHVVALRALSLMRDTSPDYLNRFMCYADTLLCLDPAERVAPAPAKAPRAIRTRLKS